MNYELFKEVVAEKIKDYMPQEYQDCKVEIHAVTKVNRDLDALNLIPAGGEGKAAKHDRDSYYKC